jgi:hypothetical protein
MTRSRDRKKCATALQPRQNIRDRHDFTGELPPEDRLKSTGRVSRGYTGVTICPIACPGNLALSQHGTAALRCRVVWAEDSKSA